MLSLTKRLQAMIFGRRKRETPSELRRAKDYWAAVRDELEALDRERVRVFGPAQVSHDIAPLEKESRWLD